jgi:hypothetical protein
MQAYPFSPAQRHNDQRLKIVDSVESARAKINTKVKALPVHQAKRKKGNHDKKDRHRRRNKNIRHL